MGDQDGTTIPQPKALPFIGNTRELDPSNTNESLMQLADTYGPIFRLKLLTATRVFLGSQELVNEMCDEKRFAKRPIGSLAQVRNGTSDGLFTAYSWEENWGIAHRVLMPMFGPLAIKGMFEEMHEMACQMLSSFARHGPDHRISPTEEFTKLTLDSIALCAMDTRFNSFYRQDMHPFVSAMVGFLQESGYRSLRPTFLTDYVYRATTAQYWENIDLMKKVADHVIEERYANPKDKKDLVNSMLFSEDPKTHKRMPRENVIANMITFLIAGHETTSGLLSFLFVLLLQNPSALKKAQEEVDRVVGKAALKFEHIDKMEYIRSCIRESLRLYPTAPSFDVTPLSQDDKDFPMFIGKERYRIEKGDVLNCHSPVLHRDPKVYGEDANEFRPERMSDDNFNKLPPNSWKPFGSGARACIGRAFALLEAQIAVALLLQNFNFRAEDPGYQLKISQTLTIKPKDFYMYASLRDGLDPISLEKRLWDGGHAHRVDSRDKKLEEIALAAAEKKPMSIFYGSNTGTCDALAQSLANSAVTHGYDATVKPMDAATEKVPVNQPVVFITASFEGEPPDNACHFVEWLQDLKGKEMEGVRHAVFGCGHRDWATTYQKIPKLVDNRFLELGSKAIVERGAADAADNDIFNDFDNWTDKVLWPVLAKDNKTDGIDGMGLDIVIDTNPRSNDLRQDVSEAIVKDTRTLTAPGEPEKRHIEITLPAGMTYRAGDYLAVLPVNHHKTIKAVLSRFNLAWDVKMTIKEGQNTFLPTGKEMAVYDVLSSYVELNQPATQKNLSVLQHCAPDDSTKTALKTLTSTIISNKRISVFDILTTHPNIPLSFSAYLAMLPPMRVRQYSISSSPLFSPTTVTLTYAVLDQESKSGTGKRYLGTASNYLSELVAGDTIHISVRQSSQSFHPPHDVENIPLLMACAGSGLAPFRGFVQERAAQISAGRKLAPAILWIGCRYPDRDILYQEEFEAWQKLGAIDVRYAFSQLPAKSEGCKYVQDRVWNDIKDAVELWDMGARFFVCGNRDVGEGIRNAVLRAYRDEVERRGKTKTDEEVEAWFDEVKNERFASDVFA